MIATETEMSARRCPLALVLFVVDALNSETRNGLAAGGAHVGLNCIGSKCALWCWYDYTRDGAKTYRGNDKQFTRGNAEPGTLAKAPTAPRGYCGLTGSRE